MTQDRKSLDNILKEIEELLIKKREPVRAIKHLAPLLKEHHSDSRVLTLFAHANVLMGNLKAARSLAEKASRKDRNNIRAKFILGFCHQGLKEYYEAVNIYNEITRMTPSAVAHLFLGDSLKELGDRDGAAAAYQKAAVLDEKGHVKDLAQEKLMKVKEER